MVLLVAFAALIGVLAVRRIGYGLAGLAAFAGVGVAAAVHLPTATAVDVVPTLAGVAVAAVALVVLVRTMRDSRRRPRRARARPSRSAVRGHGRPGARRNRRAGLAGAEAWPGPSGTSLPGWVAGSLTGLGRDSRIAVAS